MRSLRAALLVFMAVFPPRLLAEDADPRALFAKAHGFYAAAKMDEAKELLEKTVAAKFPLEDYSLYYLAVIASHQGKWELSRRLLSRLREQYPQSIWFHPANLQLAKIDLAEKRDAEALEKLRSLRGVKTTATGVLEEALFLEAKATETQGAAGKAYLLYQELRALYPNSRWTPLARKEIARLRSDYPDQFALNTSQAIVEEAERLVKEREYGEAELLYKTLLAKSPDSGLRLRLLASLTNVLLAVRKRDEAAPFLGQIVTDYPDSSEAPKALYQLGQMLWNRNENQPALDYFKRLTERYPSSSYASRARYAAADIYEALGKKDEAIALYSNIPAQFPATEAADNAMWRLGWLYYRTGDLSQAYAAFKQLAAHATGDRLSTAGLYWQSRCAEKMGDIEAAKELYRQAYKAGGESYYQPLAARALTRLGVLVEEAKTAGIPTTEIEGDPPLVPAVSFHLARARALADIALHPLAVLELDEINRIAGAQSGVRSLLMREYFRTRAYNRSLALANQLIGDSAELNQYRFPLAYWETIQRKAQQRKLDPYLVVALIRQESLFDAQARSPAFALGLMQLLPSTATKVAKRLGLPAPANDDLFDPEVNLTLGTQHLSDLLQRYSNNWPKAIAAYNAGERAVDRWEKDLGTDDIEEFVERIPYFETRTYVKLVMRNHQVYQRLYNLSR